MPKRIQRKRTKGWRMPPNAVCVTRPGKWGNPYTVDCVVEMPYGGTELIIDSERSIEFYQFWLLRRVLDGDLDLSELRGLDLACWCPLDKPCHADLLLELANR